MFKRHRYPNEIIIQAVYFKLRFTLSYRDVEEILRIRRVKYLNNIVEQDHRTTDIHNNRIQGV